MRIDIVVVSQPRYRRGHEKNFVPPITGIHLAALVPREHRVRVFHQQVEIPPVQTDADLVFLSFFTGFAPEAYRLAGLYQKQGVPVVAGGPHATFWPEEALQYCDCVVTGEAESVMSELLNDVAKGRLKRVYRGQSQPLEHLPTPRYDLLNSGYFLPHVIQATRGCPFSCSFCSVPSVNPGFRVRPVAEVLRDVRYDDFADWWQRQVVWFWDDNLTARRAWIKELLRAMIPLGKWWLTQASMDIVRDAELLDLMEASGCIGVFFGIETFGASSLREANKKQNRADTYREAVAAMHRRGIAVMAGFIAGFDGDTEEDIVGMADRLMEIGIDVPFLSILTPYRGTPLFDRMQAEDRLLMDRGWQYYNGYNVAFQPASMAPETLLAAHRALWERAFSPAHVTRRLLAARHLRRGAALLSAFMNGFYGFKRVSRNAPIDMTGHEVSVGAGPASAPSTFQPRVGGRP
ncbi:MAG TPA: radical SAM protein [Candidatus Xenobia bacterium]|jgi:radical SAM superfamily enzyme YgiQ (UPF0313 family)